MFVGKRAGVNWLEDPEDNIFVRRQEERPLNHFFALRLTVFNANLVKIKFNFFSRSYEMLFSPMKHIYSAIH